MLTMQQQEAIAAQWVLGIAAVVFVVAAVFFVDLVFRLGPWLRRHEQRSKEILDALRRLDRRE